MGWLKMALVDFVLDFFFFVFFVMGSSTIGYFFLRVGWPKIRLLEDEYKRGWSVIFGASFAFSTTIFAFIFSFLPFANMGFREYLFLFVGLCFCFVVLALSFVRKYYKKKRITLSIPGDFLHAKVVAQKARQQLELDPGLVIVREPQKVESIKSAFEQKKKDSLLQLIPEKKHAAQSSAVSTRVSFTVPQPQGLFENETVPEPKPVVPVQKTKEEIRKQLESKLDQIKKKSAQEEKGDLKKEKEAELERLRRELEKERIGAQKDENPLEKVLKEKKEKLKFLQGEGK